jgi:hypothetical protein
MGNEANEKMLTGPLHDLVYAIEMGNCGREWANDTYRRIRDLDAAYESLLRSARTHRVMTFYSIEKQEDIDGASWSRIKWEGTWPPKTFNSLIRAIFEVLRKRRGAEP